MINTSSCKRVRIFFLIGLIYSILIFIVCLFFLERLRSGGCENYFFFICDNLGFIPESKMWDEAKDYCQDKNRSLAKFTDIGDINSHVKKEDFPVWIGLYRDGKDKSASCHTIVNDCN